MSALTGAVELAPSDLAAWTNRLAAAQAAVHSVPPTAAAATRADGWFDPGVDRSWIPDAGLRRAALELAGAPASDDVVAHGDYQPFNVLWRDAAISGIVDWPNAGVGPRGVDVGHCRLNLAVLFSADTAEDYLQAYEAAAGVRVDVATQLRALLVWDPGWLRFIPTQIASRARIDLAGMPARVVESVRRTLALA